MYFKKECKISNKYSIFIPLPVDSIFFDTQRIDHDSFIMVTSEKIHHLKGLEELILLFNKLSNKGYNVQLKIMGSGDINYIKALTEKINLNYRSNFTIQEIGDKKKLAEFFASSDLALWLGQIPSISTNEALAVGIPIVVRKGNQGANEATNSGGIVYDPPNLSELMNKVEELILSEEKLIAKKIIAKEYAIRNFNGLSNFKKIINRLKD